MMSHRMKHAVTGWNDVPDWIEALVKACDAKGASQNKVANRLGLSGAVISQTIRNSYPGKFVNVEARVRAVFMAGNVSCPALGDIASEACLVWRDRAKCLVSASPAAVRMFTACNRCPRYLKPRGDEL